MTHTGCFAHLLENEKMLRGGSALLKMCQEDAKHMGMLYQYLIERYRLR